MIVVLLAALGLALVVLFGVIAPGEGPDARPGALERRPDESEMPRWGARR